MNDFNMAAGKDNKKKSKNVKGVEKRARAPRHTIPPQESLVEDEAQSDATEEAVMPNQAPEKERSKKNKSVVLIAEQEVTILELIKQNPMLWSNGREYSHYRLEDNDLVWTEIGQAYGLNGEYIF